MIPVQKVTPAIWFSAHGGHLKELISYYQAVFHDQFEVGTIQSLGTTPSGYAEMTDISLCGFTYTIMCTEKPHHALNDAFAIMIRCADQKEIDTYWDYLTREGSESQCGWCIDKYGLRWQIVPANMAELMAKPNAWEVMMKQKKIIIAEYGE